MKSFVFVIICLELSGICSLTMKKAQQIDNSPPLPTIETDYSGNIKINTSSAEEALIDDIKAETDPVEAQQKFEKLIKHNDEQEKYLIDVELKKEKEEITDKMNDVIKNVLGKAEDAIDDLKKQHQKEISRVENAHTQNIKKIDIDISNQKLQKLKELRAQRDASIQQIEEDKNENLVDLANEVYANTGNMQVDTAEDISNLIADSQQRKEDILSNKIDLIEDLTDEKDEKKEKLLSINEEEEDIDFTKIGTDNDSTEGDDELTSDDEDEFSDDFDDSLDLEDQDWDSSIKLESQDGEDFDNEDLIEETTQFENTEYSTAEQIVAIPDLDDDLDEFLSADSSLDLLDKEETTPCDAKLAEITERINNIQQRLEAKVAAS